MGRNQRPKEEIQNSFRISVLLQSPIVKAKCHIIRILTMLVQGVPKSALVLNRNNSQNICPRRSA